MSVTGDKGAHSSEKCNTGEPALQFLTGTDDISAPYPTGKEAMQPAMPLTEARDNSGLTALDLRARVEVWTLFWISSSKLPTYNGVGEDWRTALRLAAQNRRTDVVTTLLAIGADSEAATENAWTALHLAAWSGEVETVTILLAHRANTETIERESKTALLLAARHGVAETVAALLAQGANIEAVAKEGHTGIVNALLASKTMIEAMLNDK